MKLSLMIARIAGIGIYIHWSFVLLIAWVLGVSLAQGQTLAQSIDALMFVLAIFGCIVLHELGHALAAKRFGIRTRDITLLPIGGVARLERIPTDPTQELVIALAGPAVNVLIAGILLVVLGASGLPVFPAVDTTTDALQLNFAARLMYVNVFLILFNMLPALPMDGGRVLRALLAYGVGHLRATQIAALVGQVMAVGFAALALFVNPWLLLIALIVFMGAGAEAQMAQTRVAFSGASIADAMVTRFRSLAPGDSLASAIDELLAGSQQDFPVVEGGRLVGLLARTDLIRALANRAASTPIREVMRTNCRTVGDMDSVEQAIEILSTGDCPALPVVRGDQLIGLLTRENVSEFVMIRSALGARGGLNFAQQARG